MRMTAGELRPGDRCAYLARVWVCIGLSPESGEVLLRRDGEDLWVPPGTMVDYIVPPAEGQLGLF